LSVIKTDLLQNRLGTSHPAVTNADFVKAWDKSLYSAGVPSIISAFGISSLGDFATGYIKHNLVALYASSTTAAAYANSRANSVMLGMYADVVSPLYASTEISNTTTTQSDTASSMLTVGILA